MLGCARLSHFFGVGQKDIKTDIGTYIHVSMTYAKKRIDSQSLSSVFLLDTMCYLDVIITFVKNVSETHSIVIMYSFLEVSVFEGKTTLAF